MGRIIAHGIVGGVAGDFPVLDLFFHHLNIAGEFERRGRHERSVALPRLGERFLCNLHAVRERAVDEGWYAGFKVGLVELVVAHDGVVVAVQDTIHLAEHIIEIFHRRAAVFFRKLFLLALDHIPAVGNHHAGRPRLADPVDKRRPEALGVRSGAARERADGDEVIGAFPLETDRFRAGACSRTKKSSCSHRFF